MFSLEEVYEFLDELKLEHSPENVKWAYGMLIKEAKLDIKMQKFQYEYGSLDSCCGDDCNCDDECCSTEDCCSDDCCDADSKCCKTNKKK